MLNRNFALILTGNIILGSAMPMLIILGGLSGAWIAPQTWLATAPPSAQMLAGIVVASPISLFMGRYGRRAGFLVGAAALVLGAAVAAVSLILHSFVLLCIAHVILGGALICINYFRFAAAEAVDEKHQAQAISLTLASGLIAALVGPELFSLTKDTLSPTPLAGAYAAMAGLGILGAIPVLGLNIPASKTEASKQTNSNLRAVLSGNPMIIAAIGIAALSQAVMVLLMTPTPIAMIGCGFGADQAADVIRWHVVAMFAPGFFTGFLIRRFGAGRIAATGVFLLFLSALSACLGLTLSNFYGALILLGVGWNFGFVSGTHLLQTVVSEQQRPAVQGLNDTILAISSTAASLLSGVLYAGVGWTGLTVLAMPLLVLFGVFLLRRTRHAVQSA